MQQTLPVLAVIAAALGLIEGTYQSQIDSNFDSIDQWEFEPKVWTSNLDVDTESFSGYANQQVGAHWEPEEDQQTSINPREQNHFLLGHASLIDDLKAQQPNYKQENQQKQPECTQFKADTREAIICSKSRCDKLDFEWPTYDNQISLIETTRHGMRFHISQLAMNKSPQRSASPASQSNDRVVKLDLLDLIDKLKPPPPTTTTTSAPNGDQTTQPTVTITSSPAISTLPTTSTTSVKPDDKDPASNDGDQDKNTTELITTFRVDTRRRKQRMVGFGGALSDSVCRNIKSLSPEMGKSLMEDYFGERGLRYNIARVTVGSSDLSIEPYTNNDATNTTRRLKNPRHKQQSSLKDDVDMENFHLVSEDFDYKLPLIRQAIATSKTRELKLFASLWSPPIWMKNNSHIVHGFLKGDVYGPYYRGLAELMLKWLEAYRKQGVEFWAFTGLNEPVTGAKPFIFHNSLGITKDDYITFMKIYLGPMLRQRGFQSVKLLVLDDNKGYAPNYVKSMLKDPAVARYISGIAIHWYMSDDYENLNFISKQYPDKFILSTEACNGYLPYQVHTLPGDWDRGVAYMYDITKMIQKNSVGWVDWNMALDLGGGPSWANNTLDSPIIVNARLDEYYKSPMFYAIGHFSRFVEPNSYRLDQILANARYDYPLEAVAFHTPTDYVVIVAMNANKQPIPFRIIVDKQLIRVIRLRAQSFSTIIFKWKKF